MRPPWHPGDDHTADSGESAHTVVPFRAPSSGGVGDAPAGVRERELIAAWREAHWTLQERLRELPTPDQQEVDYLYQLARRADTDLTALYQHRAEALARQVRELLIHRVTDASVIPPAASVPLVPPAASVDGTAEHALLACFRSLAPEDRRTITDLADRLARR
ncbi:hypothetical protein TBR22_A24600 [Luteitalea sp. TBR-22]|uniref:hypothetical protein n=1 Tax=Luteitalea sp. TBR-22 TaxID=2802971 RepID=UPI001AF95190|nr:hypothetical protein [Luteitalea sp. TBR-22]BCS33233.1 hypothetical protein TBR22_A24600 [Luteitalea sp. TBR-22]